MPQFTALGFYLHRLGASFRSISKSTPKLHTDAKKELALFSSHILCYITLVVVTCLEGVACARREVVCLSADPVRFLLNGVEYRVPAALQCSPAGTLQPSDVRFGAGCAMGRL